MHRRNGCLEVIISRAGPPARFKDCCQLRVDADVPPHHFPTTSALPIMEKGISTQPHLGDEEIKPAYTTQQLETSDALDVNIKGDAFQAENAEHAMGLMEAVKLYPMACFWAFVMSFTIVMESFDMFLVGNFVALPAFKNKYGTFVSESEGYVVPTRWQTALTQAGQIGALLGIFICGPIANRYGYRVSTIVGLICMNATIFISFFGNSLPVFLVGQLLEGIPWGFFIANSPAYASEISPLALRSVCTAYLQMCWAIGSIIVGAATYALNNRADEWAFRIPFALQWLFPTPLLVLLFFAPESPWWLVRKGRHDQALRSIERLGRSSKQNASEVLAMMIRTNEIEKATTNNPTYLDLFKGTDLRRTLITCFVYAGQNFAGNLIANQAVYFFERECYHPCITVLGVAGLHHTGRKADTPQRPG
jgi:SP family general alpha glucoside:H+ symporter-like MFS transporter